MNALVTGGLGFIGSHLVERLRKDGHKVMVLDCGLLNSEMDGDVLTTYEVRDRAVDWLFHLAARADIVPSIQHPSCYHETNVTGTVRMLEQAQESGVKRFIYAASSSCYGLATELPTPETAPLSPQYPYALTKMIGEQYALHWMQVYGLPVVSLRLFNVYGPRQRTNGAYGAVLGVFLAQKANQRPLTIVGDGTQTRDFTHVSDVVDAMVKAAESDVTGVFNVGSGHPHSVNELAWIIGGERVYVPKRPGEPDCTWADATKIREALGWKPQVPFWYGVQSMLEDVERWKDAPIWTPETIAQETATWHQYLGR